MRSSERGVPLAQDTCGGFCDNFIIVLPFFIIIFLMLQKKDSRVKTCQMHQLFVYLQASQHISALPSGFTTRKKMMLLSSKNECKQNLKDNLNHRSISHQERVITVLGSVKKIKSLSCILLRMPFFARWNFNAATRRYHEIDSFIRPVVCKIFKRR